MRPPRRAGATKGFVDEEEKIGILVAQPLLVGGDRQAQTRPGDRLGFEGIGGLMEPEFIILGGGSRSIKLKISPDVFELINNTTIVENLASRPD